jgi:hypothetical protein
MYQLHPSFEDRWVPKLNRRQKLAFKLRRLAWIVGDVYIYYGPVPRKSFALDLFGIRRFISHLLYMPSQCDRIMDAHGYSWDEMVGMDNVSTFEGQY